MNIFDRPNIAVIGGGSGSSTLLHELKNGTPNVTALVNMSDDGGSSGRLREEYGVLPAGDVRQCLVALSNAPEISDFFACRYEDGPLKGHPLGNLILARLEMDQDFDYAVRMASTLLDITGKVIPITTDKHTLFLQDGDDVTMGEFAIAYKEQIHSKNARVGLSPVARIHPEAEAAIAEADVIAIAPGNVYGSLLPALAVRGVAEALRASEGLKVMVTNLVTQPGHNDGWHVADYTAVMERYIGKDALDVVLYNNQLPRPEMLAEHANPGEQPVDIDPDRFDEISARPIGDNLLAGQVCEGVAGDPLQSTRTKLRHDAARVAEHLMRLAKKAIPV